MYSAIRNDEKPLDLKTLKVLGVTPWDSSLQDAQEIVGVSPIKERHYESGRQDGQLCYVGSGITVLLNHLGKRRSDDSNHRLSPTGELVRSMRPAP